MSLSEPFGHAMQHPFLENLGWALLHFVWQGTVAAIAVGIMLLFMRKASPNARYLAACAGLLLMAVLPLVTLIMIPERQSAGTVADKIASDIVSAGSVDYQVTVEDGIPIRGSGSELSDSRPIAGTEVDVLPAVQPAVQLPVAQANFAPPALSLSERCKAFLQPCLSSMIVVWLLGVVALSVRLLLTWSEVQRLQVRGVVPADAKRTLLMQQLAGRLGVRKVVRLLESSLVEVPTVIGWLKPVILLPIATVNALTMSQLEAILAHELAHVRRADYIVNLLQSLIETLLFYHPAVWWISSRIRQEREHCCDDLAASMSGDAVGYVAALVRMEELRCEPRAVAMAARGGNLLSRVRRLLVPTVPDRIAPRWVTGAAAMLIAAALVGIPLLTKSQAGPAVAQKANSKQDKSADFSGETDEQSRTKENAKPIPAPATDNLGEITPAQIADRIDEARKRYSSVEYTADIQMSRNTRVLQPNAKPMLVKGSGSVTYRADGSRWFCEQRSFSSTQYLMQTVPTHTISIFDGDTYQMTERNMRKIGLEDTGALLYAPAEFFWQGGISSDWLLDVLRRPEATLVERIQMAETSCLHVVVEWKPEWSEFNRSFDIMICPEQGWLVRRVVIDEGGKRLAEWSIDEVAKTESGLHYPVAFKNTRPAEDAVPSMAVRISKFQQRSSFEPHEFQIPVALTAPGEFTSDFNIGKMEFVSDYTTGELWQADPWWKELAPWAKEYLDWPQHDLEPLSSLKSDSGPELAGTTAPELVPSEWLTTPGDLTWNRPGRNVTVLYFFGGRRNEPTPKRELKALEGLYHRYTGGGLEIIGIASHSSTPEKARQAILALNPSFPVMIDAKANEADILNKVPGAQWGASYVRYQLSSFTGTVVVDKSGSVKLVEPEVAGLPDGMSALESVVRKELQNSIGTAEPKLLRQSLVNRLSRLIRGTAADPGELMAAVNDQSPIWFQNAQQAIAASIPDTQIEFLKSHGLTVQGTLQELASPSSRIPDVTWYRLEVEWKKRAAAATGNGRITGRIIPQGDDAQLPGARAMIDVSDKGWAVRVGSRQLTGARAMIVVEPVLQVLVFNAPSGLPPRVDRNRIRTIVSDATGAFSVDNLPKGSYRITVIVPGKSRAVRTVYLARHESQAELNVVLSGGDRISGRITDADGNAIPAATITAVKRFISSDRLRAGTYTTEHLPGQPAITSDSGDFSFDELHEGVYQFEVRAEGFETTTTEAVPAGDSSLRVILNPAVTGG